MSQPKWITDRKPEPLQTVLLRCRHSEPVWIGWVDFNNKWKSYGGGTISSVTGWMSLRDAATLLDAPSNAELAESLK